MRVSNSKIIINCDETEIIKLIKSPNNLEKFHPFCKKNKVVVWNKEKSIDFVEYHNNKIYKRKFIDWSDNGYNLDIYEKRKLANISWNVVKISNNKSSLIITAVPYLPFKYKIINQLIFKLYVKPMLKNYLNSVVKGLKYYIETKNIIKEDQFGKHMWYSTY